MVEHDSIILPGRVGKVTQEVRLAGMHGGKFSKGVTVTSNDSKNPTLRLTLSGEVMPVLGVAPGYLRLKSGTEQKEVTLRTAFKELKVKEVSFSAQGKKSGPTWQDALPFFIEHTTKRDEKPDEDGYYSYTVTVSLKNKPDGTQNGQFVIKTNHPEKPEITIRGMLEPGE